MTVLPDYLRYARSPKLMVGLELLLLKRESAGKHFIARYPPKAIRP